MFCSSPISRTSSSSCRRFPFRSAVLSLLALQVASLLSAAGPTAAMSPPSMIPPARTTVVHTAPQGVEYATNPTVFGKILRGELPARVWLETNQLLAFQDRSPRAPLHALVIPKQFVRDITRTTKEDLPLLTTMREMGFSLVQHHFPEAARTNDYILCVHIPPFNSIDHLHLHVLAPASQMQWWWRDTKYRSETPWCTRVDTVLQRLQQGQSPVAVARWWFGAD